MLVLYSRNIKHFFRNKFFSKNLPQDNNQFSNFIFDLIGFNSKNLAIYKEAFTHSSLKSKNQNLPKNFERLEFLGDSVLGMVVSEYIFLKAPEKKEGELSQLRSKIVNRNYLNQVGKQLGLENHLIKDPNQQANNDINGNLLEALVGAIYLDKGFDQAKKFVTEKIISSEKLLEKIENQIVSYRGYLLEWAQKAKKVLEYKIYEEENANNFTIFVCEIFENNKILARGREVSKKKAIEKASKRAYYVLKNQVSI